jgi:serine/threonine protein kinase
MTLTLTRLNQDDFCGVAFGDFAAAQPLATDSVTTLYLGQRTSVRFVQPVVLHILHAHLARDRDLIAMLREGTRMASAIDHPNVCRVFDFGEAHGTFYSATQYLHGERLSTLLRSAASAEPAVSLAPELLAYVVAQAADGLYGAHMATDSSGLPLRIAHAELSPQQLHVGYDGSVCVLDFGMAKALDHVQPTNPDILKGRCAYLAPEQIRGDELDQRTDVWSLGVILRESLTGTPLFRGRSAAEVIHSVLNEPPPPWPEHVPAALREIAERAMQHQPHERYPNASAMSTDLRLFITRGESDVQASLTRSMRTLFEERIEEKQALLHQVFEQTQLHSSPAAVSEEPLAEEPTRAWFDDGALPRFDAAEPEVNNVDNTGSRSRVRLAANTEKTPRVSGAGHGAEATLRPASGVVLLLEQAIARRPLPCALALLLLGMVLGAALALAL